MEPGRRQELGRGLDHGDRVRRWAGRQARSVPRQTRTVSAFIAALTTLAVACVPGAEQGAPEAPSPAQIEAAAHAAVEAALSAELERIAALADSVDQLFRPVPFLTPAQENGLRRYLNARHLARARALGIRPGADAARLESLLAEGRLVELEPSTEHWIVRPLDRSAPYVVPAVRAMLVELGERFQARLAAMGAPRYRFEISSVLRTAADQAALRRSNPNAARGVSAHEYATTVDVAYNGFAAPLRAPGHDHDRAPGAPASLSTLSTPGSPGSLDSSNGVLVAGPNDAAPAEPQVYAPWLAAYLERVEDRELERVAGRRAGELKAILGGVLREMQAEGKVLVTLERQQPVFHLTVGRR